MKDELHMYDTVALFEDLPVEHFETHKPIMLRRGQVGTIVMEYGGAFEVEFCGPDGRTYALVAIPAEKLVLLKDSPEIIAA